MGRLPGECSHGRFGRQSQSFARVSHPRLAVIAAAIAASVAFGLYHFAHSPPFDTWRMVGLLTVVGFATGAFFFVSRDVRGPRCSTVFSARSVSSRR